MLLRLSLLLIITCTFIECKNANSSEAENYSDVDASKYQATNGLFKMVDPQQSGVDFINEATDQLIENIFYYEYSFNGGGVAIGDINNDGLDDLLFSSSIGENKLYLNQGNLKFKDITKASGINVNQGINTGVCFVDINSDGFLDIYISRSGNLTDIRTRKNLLLINNKNLSFSEKAVEYGLADMSYTTQSYFYDFDLDGDLDVYILNHPIGWGKQDRLKYNYDDKGKMYMEQDTSRAYVSDRLLINDNGKFIDKTKQYGIENLAFGLSANIGDFNSDNYPDIYVANDYVQPDQFMINKGGKSFSNEIDNYFKNISTTSMGGDVFDANNDGELDIFINDMMPASNRRMKENRSYVNYDAHLIARQFKYHDQFRYNSFQIKNSIGKFSNVAQMTGTAKTDWSWAVLGEDYDHNGHIDLFITNGYYKDLNNADYASFTLDSIKRKTPKEKFLQEWKKAIKSVPLKNYFFSNTGDMNYDNVSYIWNSGEPSFSNGAAYSDLDNDGDLDLVVNNLSTTAFIMENTLNAKQKIQFVDISLRQEDKNNFAIGAELTLEYSDGTSMHKLFNPIRGYMSSCSYRTLFGIPASKQIKRLIVKWNDGKTEEFTNLKLNTNNLITKGKGTSAQLTKANSEINITETTLNWRHTENLYEDFKGEPLLHLKNSVEGPAIAVGDVNGDGKEDIYFGGAADQPSVIYTQSNGSWRELPNPGLAADAKYEDTDAAITDIDGDGDNDLICISGGYQWMEGSGAYPIRAYENDGKGNFKFLEGAFGRKQLNAASLELVDVDNDKDMDIFIGGGPQPNKYPYAETSVLFINNGGFFNDKSEEYLPNMGKLGLVKDAKVIDINNDKFYDLVIGGDWQEVKILINQGGKKFVENQDELGLRGTNGLWQSFWTGDIDNDGDQDIIAGNLGTNTFFKASKEKPTCIYNFDYDDNKESDPILCTYFGEKSYPVHSRDRLLAHMTKMRKKVLRYRDYAPMNIDQLFEGKHKKADVFNIYEYMSCAFLNNGGKFTKIPLPSETQLSMINGIDAVSINNEKLFFITGNFWDTDFDFGKYDASTGVVLRYINNKFQPVKVKGFNADKNIRTQNLIKIDNKNCLLVGVNNDHAVLYKW